jgi:low affinity Fe/Cu permease
MLDAPDTRRRWVERHSLGWHWRRGLIRPSKGPGLTPPLAGSARRRGRAFSSRALHRLGDFTAHAVAGLLAALAVLTWLVVGIATGFPNWWQTVLESVSSSITLVMVFAIQHTQSRQQSATQRKLDELLRALPSADDHLIAAEQAPDEELDGLATLNLEDRRRADEPHPN